MSHFPSSFFNYIFCTFGGYSVGLLKSWIKIKKAIIKSKVRVKFLKHCIKCNIYPPHLYHFLDYNIHLNQHLSANKFNNMKKTFIISVLKMELNDAFRTLDSSHIQIFRLERKITQHIPFYICHLFFTKQEATLGMFFEQ